MSDDPKPSAEPASSRPDVEVEVLVLGPPSTGIISGSRRWFFRSWSRP